MRPGVFDPSVSMNVSSRKKGCSSHKMKYSAEDLSTIAVIPLSQKTISISLPFAMSIPRTYLWRLLQSGQIMQHSSMLKPFLIDQNKQARMEFSCSFFLESGMFHGMMGYIHIGEKCFYMTNIKDNYYLLPDKVPLEINKKIKGRSQPVLCGENN